MSREPVDVRLAGVKTARVRLQTTSMQYEHYSGNVRRASVMDPMYEQMATKPRLDHGDLVELGVSHKTDLKEGEVYEMSFDTVLED